MPPAFGVVVASLGCVLFCFFFGGESDFLFIAKRWKKPRELAVASWSFSTSGNFFEEFDSSQDAPGGSFLQVFSHGKNVPPLKTNMTMENQPFEHVFPIENGDFPLS